MKTEGRHPNSGVLHVVNRVHGYFFTGCGMVIEDLEVAPFGRMGGRVCEHHGCVRYRPERWKENSTP